MIRFSVLLPISAPLSSPLRSPLFLQISVPHLFVKNNGERYGEDKGALIGRRTLNRIIVVIFLVFQLANSKYQLFPSLHTTGALEI